MDIAVSNLTGCFLRLCLQLTVREVIVFVFSSQENAEVFLVECVTFEKVPE